MMQPFQPPFFQLDDAIEGKVHQNEQLLGNDQCLEPEHGDTLPDNSWDVSKWLDLVSYYIIF